MDWVIPLKGWSYEMRDIHARYSHIKFVLPTASVKPVTINMGMRCTSWYDIKSLSTLSREDFKGLDESTERITRLIEEEIKSGIDSTRIILGGFSQGGAVSMHVGYHYAGTLGGVMALSGYLPLTNYDQMFEVNEKARATPLLVCHSTGDDVVKFEWRKGSYEALTKAGVKGELKSYQGMAHSSCPQEMRDVAAFIATHLPA